MRGDELGGDAAAEGVGEGVGKRASDDDVTGGEGAEVLVLDSGLPHRAVVHKLACNTPGAPFADTLDKGSAGSLGTLHVGHVVEVDGLVADAVDQGRVVEDERGIVVSQGDVVATQGCHMGAHWQTEEIVGRLTLLGGKR